MREGGVLEAVATQPRMSMVYRKSNLSQKNSGRSVLQLLCLFVFVSGSVDSSSQMVDWEALLATKPGAASTGTCKMFFNAIHGLSRSDDNCRRLIVSVKSAVRELKNRYAQWTRLDENALMRDVTPFRYSMPKVPT